jgi:hypothetical protein
MIEFTTTKESQIDIDAGFLIRTIKGCENRKQYIGAAMLTKNFFEKHKNVNLHYTTLIAFTLFKKLVQLREIKYPMPKFDKGCTIVGERKDNNESSILWAQN